MGQHLGEGHSYSEAKKKFMPNDTVEGAELAFEIGPKILKDLSKKDFPIMYSLVESFVKIKNLLLTFYNKPIYILITKIIVDEIIKAD